MRAFQRFLEYVSFHTTSDPFSKTVPSTERQFRLAEHLVEEMRGLGFSNVTVEKTGCVYGFLPATPGLEQQETIGFIAHMDTAPDASGENVHPQIIEHYDGGDILLSGSGDVLSPRDFPGLSSLIGMKLITTDGTTLLGADDKAGIAEILTACETILRENTPHGKIAVAFTPDEEIGQGVSHFNLDLFDSVYAYTVDGGREGEISYETFNAASCEAVFTGLSVHPGSAKDTMINAALLAMEFNAMLPSCDIPRLTEKYEGFFHLTSMEGSCEQAKLTYIVRDHDRSSFEARKNLLRHAAKVLCERYGKEVVKLKLKDSYYNMEEKIRPHMHLVENAKEAARRAGMEPFCEAVRGGTDGCRLSFMGLPTPNLCTGGFAYHGRFEHIAAESMDRCTEMVRLLMTELR